VFFGPGIACFPATGLQLLEWIAALGAEGRSFHGVKHLLGNLRSHHVDLGLSVAGFSCGRLERAHRGFKRSRGLKIAGPKLPITLPLLRSIITTVSHFSDLPARDRTTLCASYALAFACFLRSGELTWSSSSDRASLLTVGAVVWHPDHAIVTLPASKTDPFRQGVQVVAPRVGGVECPYALLAQVTAGRFCYSPLFALGPLGSEPLTREFFVSTLRRALLTLGLPADRYAGHSFRRGAATWAARTGVPSETIQLLGRWTSDCYRRYIERSPAERRTLTATSLFAVRDGPLLPDLDSWRDV
jgi:hypothetical protein